MVQSPQGHGRNCSDVARQSIGLSPPTKQGGFSNSFHLAGRSLVHKLDHKLKGARWSEKCHRLFKKVIKLIRSHHSRMTFGFLTYNVSCRLEIGAGDIAEPSTPHFSSGLGQFVSLRATVILMHEKPSIRERGQYAGALMIIHCGLGPSAARPLREHLIEVVVFPLGQGKGGAHDGHVRFQGEALRLKKVRHSA